MFSWVCPGKVDDCRLQYIMGHGRAKAEREARFEVVVWELDFAAGERFIAQETGEVRGER